MSSTKDKSSTNDGRGESQDATVLDRLVASHREFLAFLERQVGDGALAEDLLQDAFVRSLEKGHELREHESLRAWFYRILRHAVIDRHRRNTRQASRLADLAASLQERQSEVAAAAERVICACIDQLLETMPAEHSRALRRIELDGVAVKDFAREAGITESNAGVRVHRARKALREQVARACGTCAEHGCVDCCCKQA